MKYRCINAVVIFGQHLGYSINIVATLNQLYLIIKRIIQLVSAERRDCAEH